MSNGVIIYDGPSMLDNKPIVAIATGLNNKSSNEKTGDMIQVWIIRSDISPMDAANNGEDYSICGDCIHRGNIENGKNKNRSCYVLLFTAPTNIYKAYKSNKYPMIDNISNIFKNRLVRLGAYGDPAALPFDVIKNIVQSCDKHTGYTHQWKKFPELNQFVMASVDNIDEYNEAQSMGFRTFRVTTNIDDVLKGLEFICPASKEKNKVLSCSECKACGGNTSANKASVVIKVHGIASKIKAFTEHSLT